MNRRHLIVGPIASAASVLARGMDPLWRWDAIGLAAAIAARGVSSREATRSCLSRIAAAGASPPGDGAVPAG